jgi:acylphosphatase
MRTVEINVTGKVQGVFYRQSAREKAIALGLTGYVENLSNGSVRLIVTGEENLIEDLYQWCRTGPRDARVISITRTTIPLRPFSDFAIRRR